MPALSTRTFHRLLLAIAAGPVSYLSAQPAQSFQGYANVVETRILGDIAGSKFLRLAQSDEARERLRSGEIMASSAATLGVKPSAAIAEGQIHHWVGAIFLPCETLADAIPRLQDYDHRARFMRPEVLESRQMSREGDNFEVYLRLHEKSIVSGTFDAYLGIAYQMLDETHLLIQSRSEKIVEVQGPDSAEGDEVRNRGLLLGLNHYWRIVEKDGGLYIECEALVLSRKPPGLLQLIADPMIAQAARKTVVSALETTKRIVEGSGELF